eukprot:UN26700
MNFFAVCPSAWRPADRSQMDTKDFVVFPALRPPNYSDEVDLMYSGEIPMKVKNRWGEAVEITLRDFLKNIGHFITDVDIEADWSDPCDMKKMQVANQFSILPAPTGSADVGIAAFGYQSKNLHVIIGPGGDIGWGPEHKSGMAKIYFREKDERKTISLVPEDRQEVKEKFFKKEEEETVEQEAERYEKTENFVPYPNPNEST